MLNSLVNRLCCLSIIIVICTLFYKGIPHRRGFHCSDSSIRYPFEDLIVGLSTILASNLVIPPLIIYYLSGRKYLAQYYFGHCANLLITMVAKFTTGRLRPHFIAVCRPNVDCDASHSSANVVVGGLQNVLLNHDEYITDYICLNTDIKAVNQARQSFFSGHASISIYSAAFLVLFIEKHYCCDNLGKPTIQLIALILGFIPGLTQVMNYWHHWSDVATGYFVGILIAYLCFNYVLRSRRQESGDQEQLDNVVGRIRSRS